MNEVRESIRAQIEGRGQIGGGKYYVKQRKQTATKENSHEEAGSSHHGNKAQVLESGTHQGGRNAARGLS